MTQSVGETVKVSVAVAVIDPRRRRRRSERLSVAVTESNVYVKSVDIVVVKLPVRRSVTVSVNDMVSGRVAWLRVVVMDTVVVRELDRRSDSVATDSDSEKVVDNDDDTEFDFDCSSVRVSGEME